MTEKDDGGRAFPYGGQMMNPDGKWAQDGDPGMTLRQWYAGLAMQGLLASTMDERGATAIRAVAKDQGKGVVEVVASTAIGFAEALIAELKK